MDKASGSWLTFVTDSKPVHAVLVVVLAVLVAVVLGMVVLLGNVRLELFGVVIDPRPEEFGTFLERKYDEEAPDEQLQYFSRLIDTVLAEAATRGFDQQSRLPDQIAPALRDFGFYALADGQLRNRLALQFGSWPDAD